MHASHAIRAAADEIELVTRNLRVEWNGSSWVRGQLRSRIERDVIEPVLIVASQHVDQLNGLSERACRIEAMLT